MSGDAVKIPKGKLTLVVGPTGSGKTTMLLALMGQLKHKTLSEVGNVEDTGAKVLRDGEDGFVAMGGVAYVPQKAWIYNDKVRQNVLFSLPYHEKAYKKALELSCLKQDVDNQFDGGDQYELAEKGANLSGGQRQRVAIARALYYTNRADVTTTIMDDPMSALDAKVRRQLFVGALRGRESEKLKTCTRILATHQLQFTADADYIVVIDKDEETGLGFVKEAGSFRQLCDRPNGKLKMMLQEAGMDAHILNSEVKNTFVRVPVFGVGETRPELVVHSYELRSLESIKQLKVLICQEEKGFPDVELVSLIQNGVQLTDTMQIGQLGEISCDNPILIEFLNDARVVNKGPRKTAKQAASGVLVAQEASSGSGLDYKNIQDWLSYGGTWYTIGGVLLFAGLWQGVAVTSNNLYQQNNDKRLCFLCDPISSILLHMGLLFLSLILQYIGKFIFVGIAFSVSRNLVAGALQSVLRSPDMWYKTNPVGRVMNVFTKDVMQADMPIFVNFCQVIDNSFVLLGIGISISLGQPVFLIALVATFCFLVAVQQYFAKSKVALQDLDARTRAPLLNQLEETVDGMVTVRAFQAEAMMLDRFYHHIHINSSTIWLSYNLQGWLTSYLGLLGATVTGTAAVAVLTSRLSVAPSVNLTALAYMMQVSQSISNLVTALTTAEQTFNSFIRIRKYVGLQSEDHPMDECIMSPEEISKYEVLKELGDDTDPDVVLEKATEWLTQEKKTHPLNDQYWLDKAAYWTTQTDYPMGLAWDVVHDEAHPEPKFCSDPAPVIEFRNVVMRYRPELRPSMRNVSFTVNFGEKVGICGRTGAGKSTMVGALFRLAELDSTRLNEKHVAHKALGWKDGVGPGYQPPEPDKPFEPLEDKEDPKIRIPGCNTPVIEGRGFKLSEGGIFISGEDISNFRLHDIRRHICMIPQEPAIFLGSIKHNVDPMGEHTEEEVWDALDAAGLKKEVRMMQGGLKTKAADAFSVGQKQLLCLARAVIRRPKILILDEVTANVDIDTDHKIQQTIRERFMKDGCTQLAIAHRIDTIIDADKILVMEEGQLAEFDHPHVLLQNQEGIFYSLVNNDKDNAASLIDIAKSMYDNRGSSSHDKAERIMREMEKNRAADRAAKAEKVVPKELRKALGDILQKLNEFDDDLNVHPHDPDAQLKVEELWKILEPLRTKMENAHYKPSEHRAHSHQELTNEDDFSTVSDVSFLDMSTSNITVRTMAPSATSTKPLTNTRSQQQMFRVGSVLVEPSEARQKQLSQTDTSKEVV